MTISKRSVGAAVRARAEARRRAKVAARRRDGKAEAVAWRGAGAEATRS